MLLSYKGEWDCIRNVPELSDGIGAAGDTYLIYQQPPFQTGYFIYDRDMGSGVISLPALCYIYYDGFVWKLLEGTPGTGSTTSYREVTSTATMEYSDFTINCTSGTFLITLLSASGIQGKILVIKNSGVGVITVDTTASETIDGGLTAQLPSQYSITLQSTGSNWIII